MTLNQTEGASQQPTENHLEAVSLFGGLLLQIAPGMLDEPYMGRVMIKSDVRL